jgi:two-component system response regulator WspF
MTENPCAVLIVTATVSGSASGVFEAMGHGALDAVNTPVAQPGGGVDGAQVLLDKIATIGKLIGRDGPRRISVLSARTADVPVMVAIGSSTGGPKALSEILSRLPQTIAATVVIVQHVDARFAPGMAEWLNSRSALRVQVASEGTRPVADSVWLAGTNDHLIIRPDLTLGYTVEPRSSPYRPSADVFFRSAAQHWPVKGTAALLTGMGRDGAEGLLALRRAGWQTLAQEESSCVVYGMPKAAAEIGAAERIASLEEIALRIART